MTMMRGGDVNFFCTVYDFLAVGLSACQFVQCVRYVGSIRLRDGHDGALRSRGDGLVELIHMWYTSIKIHNSHSKINTVQYSRR
jgi:hypothetical protein